MKHVISASRRTDIPAFYLDWMIDHLRKGHVKVKNPFYPSQVSNVSLKKEDVHSIVLWSKDFSKFLKQISEFSDYNLFFHFTINDCKKLEPNIPSLNQRLLQMKKLTEEFNPELINWRFDPIVYWEEGGEIKHNLGSFERKFIFSCVICFFVHSTAAFAYLLNQLISFNPTMAASWLPITVVQLGNSFITSIHSLGFGP